ncbi:MAG TPA: dihydroneopterin aldolase, partial [Candidatus Acidoferrales bacterium]|nr:dihydroneopterin aldolase [Candidatus Acidoferrales bacterium]
MSGEASGSGTIRISNMRFWGKHGANSGERNWVQPIDVDVEIGVELATAASSDELSDTIDYGSVYTACSQIVTQQSYVLLEALADRIAAELCQYPKVIEVVVRVRKPR